MAAIDGYIERRNAIQLRAENRSKEEADKTWAELGVANRHITRVIEGILPLPLAESEIENCLTRVERLEQDEQASA